MICAQTISHYITIASQGRVLDSGNIAELEDAIQGLVDEAVARAVAACKEAEPNTGRQIVRPPPLSAPSGGGSDG